MELATTSDQERRVVVLLSDGAEFGGASDATREAARLAAQEFGVPVYPIGLGYGIDRTYLQELAEASGARFFESPQPSELTAVYDDIAQILSTQYVITLESNQPGDGNIYNLPLAVETDQGTLTGEIEFRAAINEPLITVPDDLPTEPITEATSFTVQVQADDGITDATLTVGGEETSGQRAERRHC